MKKHLILMISAAIIPLLLYGMLVLLKKKER